MSTTKRSTSRGGDVAALRVKPTVNKPAKSSSLEPGLKPLERMFPAEKGFDALKAERDLQTVFGDLAGLRERNPFGNSVKLLALEVGKRLDKGKLSLGSIETLIQELTTGAFEHRAERLQRYLGESDPQRNEQKLRDVFQALAAGSRRPAGKGKSARIPFQAFKAAVERELFGIVITGHPTFSQSHEMVRLLAELGINRSADGQKVSAARRRKILSDARAVEHRPPEKLDLGYEYEMSVAAIANIHGALRRAYEIALDVAAENYPDEWEQLSPRLMTVASWVGYDLDGRSDIKWSDTLFTRLKIQVLQLQRGVPVRGDRVVGDAAGQRALDEVAVPAQVVERARAGAGVRVVVEAVDPALVAHQLRAAVAAAAAAHGVAHLVGEGADAGAAQLALRRLLEARAVRHLARLRRRQEQLRAALWLRLAAVWIG